MMRTADGGRSFALPAVFVMRIRDGQIVRSRDHTGPRRMLDQQE